jgi:glutamyl-tRNA reductase
MVAGDAVERALAVIWTFAIKPGKHHRRSTLWTRRAVVVRVWKVRIGRHEIPRLYALGTDCIGRGSMITLRARPKHRLGTGGRGLR